MSRFAHWKQNIRKIGMKLFYSPPLLNQNTS